MCEQNRSSHTEFKAISILFYHMIQSAEYIKSQGIQNKFVHQKLGTNFVFNFYLNKNCNSLVAKTTIDIQENAQILCNDTKFHTYQGKTWLKQ